MYLPLNKVRDVIQFVKSLKYMVSRSVIGTYTDIQ
jgi:hypothetical protein